MTVLEIVKQRIHDRVNQLENQPFSNNLPTIEALEWVMDILPEYFPKEKQQIMDAYNKGVSEGQDLDYHPMSAEDYYTNLKAKDEKQDPRGVQ